MSRGLKNNKANDTTYVTMSRGEFVKRVKEETKASRSRKLEKGVNQGSVVHEEFFNEFTGQLIGIKVEHHPDFGSSWAFKFDVTVAEPEFLILKLPYSSGYSNNVLTRLPNINNFANDLTLKGYKFKPADKEKEIMGISMIEYIGDSPAKVTPFYTRETPNGIPEMKQIKVKGKDVWDDSERLEFLQKMVDRMIVPNLVEQPKAGTEAQVEELPEGVELDENGLPF